jgi:hypothetical protein
MPTAQSLNSIIPLLLLGAALSGILAMWMAFKRERNPILWLLLGVLLPFLSLLALAILGESEEKKWRHSSSWKGYQQKPAIEEAARVQDEVQIKSEDDYVWYFVKVDGERVGPARFSRLVDCYKAGEVNNDSLVWNDSMHEWKKIGDMKNLQNKFDSNA